jgi:hypothetical protein
VDRFSLLRIEGSDRCNALYVCSIGVSAVLTEVSVAFLSPSGQMSGQYFDQATAASFNVLSN